MAISRLLLPVGVALFTAAAGVFVFQISACRVSTSDAPDANQPCQPGPHPFCPGDASEGCGTANEPEPLVAQIPPGVYATGCVVDIVSADKYIGGDCRTSICRCDAPDDAGPDAAPGRPHWTCFK